MFELSQLDQRRPIQGQPKANQGPAKGQPKANQRPIKDQPKAKKRGGGGFDQNMKKEP